MSKEQRYRDAGRVGSVIAVLNVFAEYCTEADPATMILWLTALVLMRARS